MFSITRIKDSRQQPTELVRHQSGELDGRDVRRANSHACREELIKIKSVESQELPGSTKNYCLQDRKISRITKFGQEAQGTVGIGSGLTIKRKSVEPQPRPLSNGSDTDLSPRKRTKIESPTSDENRTAGTERDEPTGKSEDVLARKITERLEALKMKYQNQFDFIINNSFSSIFQCKDSTEPLAVKTNGIIGRFYNEYKPDQWRFLNNQKEDEYRYKHHFYASNVVAHQYEYLSEVNQTKKTLPKTIINMGVVNPKSTQVIYKYAGRHNSEEFKNEFLTTDNGKRTARVANDFGLIIEDLKVDYDRCNVTFRVSPDPKVYGNPQALDVSN